MTREQEAASVQNVRNDWKTLVEKVSYKAIVNNIPYLAFLAFICVLYINNSQRAIDVQRELSRENKKLKELRWRYMDIKTQLMYTRMETEVMKGAAGIGLKPLMLPAYSITKDTI